MNLFKKVDIYIPYSTIFSNDNKNLISGSNQNYDICIYDVENFNLLDKLKGHTYIIFDLIISKCDKYLASASCDKIVILWDF